MDNPDLHMTHLKTDEDWHKMLATHLDSTFYCTREALKVMIPKQSGRIINMGSIAGTTGLAFASDYCAAKGGIISFTKSVAREVVPMGMLVNCIAPGFIETPMTAPIPSRGAQAGRSDARRWAASASHAISRRRRCSLRVTIRSSWSAR